MPSYPECGDLKWSKRFNFFSSHMGLSSATIFRHLRLALPSHSAKRWYYYGSRFNNITAACHAQTHMQHVRTRYTYNTHYSAHKRLIFTAKPPTMCTCTYIYTIYIRSGERTINLHFIELKRWRDRSLYTLWQSCYYGVILLNRNRLSRNLSSVGPSGVRIRLLRRRHDHVISKLQTEPNSLVGFGWANIA